MAHIDKDAVVVATAKKQIDRVSRKLILWNKENIFDLKELLDVYHYNQDAHERLTGETYNIELEYLICFLPSELIPQRKLDTSFGRVWAMDKQGMCLVGQNYDMLMPLEDLCR